MIMLLMFALFTSYILQQRKIQAVHETVLSIFAGGFYISGEHFRPFDGLDWLVLTEVHDGRHVCWLGYSSECCVADSGQRYL